MYWYHPDHLGSSSFITGIDGEVTQNIEYFPSGETFVENHLNSYNTPYLYNSKELDDETGYYYYGARYYNPRVSLWLNVDPLASYDPIMNAEHYIDGQHNGGVYNSGNLNPYIYTYQNPVKYIDPNGKQVDAVYNKRTGKLAIIPDLSKVNPKLRYKYVSAQEYGKLTMSDKAKYNYGILVRGVFTGGHSDNGQIVYGDTSRPNEKPISAGKYNILENKGNTNPDHASFFVLDPVDSSPYNKVDDRPGEINAQGEKRSGYNLHPGNVSWGCVTICSSNTLTPEAREEEWDIINKAINATKTEKVPDNRGKHKYFPGKQIKFGTLKVVEK